MSPPPPPEQPREKTKPKPKTDTNYIPAKEHGITIYTNKSNPFPKIITYQHLQDCIFTDKYKITFTIDKTIEEIKQAIQKKQNYFYSEEI